MSILIASLEAQLAAARKRGAVPKNLGRRGRKSMSASERQEVSKRMTLYWEARRAQLRELGDGSQVEPRARRSP